jgi:hypothetical protein
MFKYFVILLVGVVLMAIGSIGTVEPVILQMIGMGTGISFILFLYIRKLFKYVVQQKAEIIMLHIKLTELNIKE